MSDGDMYTWRAALLMHAYNEAMASRSGAALDLQTWLRTHFQRWPVAFAYYDWSNYQPAMRKIRLLKIQA